MILVYFVYGLSFFTLSLAVGLESRRASSLPLGRQLGWLAGFGLTHALVEWADLFRLIQPDGPADGALLIARTVLLPLSAVLLVRFGIGLINEAGPLPNWLNLLPVVLIVPAALLVTYGLIVAITESPVTVGADIWSRYLLYFPGCLLAAFGFVRQWLGLRRARLSRARNLMLGAALAFVFNAFAGGLVVPASGQASAVWLNADTWLAWTGVPVQIVRMMAALAVTLFVVWALDVFEGERAQRLAELQDKRQQSQQAALEAQSAARAAAEQWTMGLTDISRRIARLEDVDQVLAALVQLSCRLLRADIASVALWNDDRTQLVVKCYASAAGSVSGRSIAVTNPVILQVVADGQPCRYPADVAPPVPVWFCPTLQQQLPAAAIVPLLLDDQVIGGMWVGRVETRPISASDLTGLEHLADQAVIAVQHGLMAAQMQSVAVVDERSRIAREMHDGLAQILGYLSLELQRLEALAGQANAADLVAALRQARERVRAAQADVRENIASLRTTLAGEVGLLPALRQYLEEFGIQTGMEASLAGDLANNPRLSPLAEVQLVRVIQEALANVRKHARAGTVQVRLTRYDHTLQVQVTDDGCGFEPALSLAGHFGLQTMRERLQSIGGCLNIESQPGAGTRVQMSVPLV
jgi:signal transduction histidine kinase